MKNDEEIFESLITGGLIGATLGAILTNKSENGTILGAMAGAAILATFKANQKAMQTNLPMFVEENGNLYQIQSGGMKKLIRKIDKPSIRLKEHFKLV
ncbi:MAG: hypothetical protein JNL95_06170 [Chitinophagales bacterium]|nr:hypothetical protein [Chitinophagales bacterium]